MIKNLSFKKINQSSVVQQVIDALTGAMINKQLRPGDKIPTEIELAESMGVGRMSVREAVKVLVYFGVLEIRRPEGTFVCEGFSPTMLDPMLYGIILSANESFENLKELRHMIEVGTIKIAAQKATEADLEELRKQYAVFEQAVHSQPVDINAVFDADDAFHECLAKLARNGMVGKISALVRTLTHELRYQTVKNMIEAKEGDTLLAAHKEICDIISANKSTGLDDLIQKGYFYDKVHLRDSSS